MRDEDIRCLLSFVAHFDWLSPHNRSTFQRCLHTYVNLSSGCNTFMSRFAQSQPGTHLNVQKCDRRHSLFVVVAAHFDWLPPHNRSTFQRCLHTYVNLSSGCNTFMSRLAQSQPGTHLNVHKCETKTFVVCCRLLHTSIDCLHTIAALFNDVCIPM